MHTHTGPGPSASLYAQHWQPAIVQQRHQPLQGLSDSGQPDKCWQVCTYVDIGLYRLICVVIG